jgi:hypothetical protein
MPGVLSFVGIGVLLMPVVGVGALVLVIVALAVDAL